MPQSFWSGRSVLVTGASGFLGGWLVPSLVEKGAMVVALVSRRAPRGTEPRGEWFHQVVPCSESVTDFDSIFRILSEHSVASVIHLAGRALVDDAMSKPAATLEANVRGTWTVLEAARQAGVREVVIASSNKVYRGSAIASREDDPLAGDYPYDVSKACADLVARMYGSRFGIRTAAARCGNLFGGGDLNFSRIIPGVIRASLAHETFALRGDGTSTRDFLYVEDAVAAYLLLCEQLSTCPELSGQAFNFSLGRPVAINEVVQTVIQLTGSGDFHRAESQAPQSEAHAHCMDISKATGRLAWSPRFPFESGLRKTIDWYREYDRRGGLMAGDSTPTLAASR